MKKKIIIVISALILMSFFIIPVFANNNIKVGYYDDYPLVFKNEKGKADGFIIDIINEMNRNNDYNIEYVYGSWGEVLNKLKTGKIDLVLDILESKKRKEVLDFNKKPLFLNYGKICINEKYNIESLSDLEKYKIGYVDEDYYAVEKNGLIDLIKRFDLDVEYAIYKDYDEMLNAIENNYIQACILNRTAINKIYNYKNIRETQLVFVVNGVKIATQKNKNQDFLTQLDELIEKWEDDENSFYNRRYNYWLNHIDKTSYEIFFYENKWKIFFLIMFISIIFIFLKIQIVLKNNKLNKSYEDNYYLISKFENLINFFSLNHKVKYDFNDSFLKSILKEAFNLVDEADYALAYKYNLEEGFCVIDSINIKTPEKSILKKKFENYIEDNKDTIEKQVVNSSKSILVNFNWNNSYIGILLDIELNKKHSFKKESIKMMKVLKSVVDSYLLNESMYKMHENFQKEIIFSFIQMLEIHDEYTKGHSEAVANLASDLAKKIGLSDNKVEEIYWAGLVHDIGKILIDKKIINKKGRLTFREYEIIKRHPEFGYKALVKSKVTKDIAKYILHHHERVDGIGYPKGLSKDEIPLESKIIALADTYDAMISNRIYKKSMTEKQALDEIRDNLGTQFDKELGLIFIEMVEDMNKE